MGAVTLGTAAYIHANSRKSPKPNIVYEIFAYNPVVGYQTMKYGVSSAKDFIRRSGNPRPEYQVMTLNALEPAGTGTYYWYLILARTTDRATALDIEKSLVENYMRTHNNLRPPMQLRP